MLQTKKQERIPVLELPISRSFLRKLKEETEVRRRAIWREVKSIPDLFHAAGKTGARTSLQLLDKDVYLHVFTLPVKPGAEAETWYISFRYVKVWNQVRIADYGLLPRPQAESVRWA